ncbi:MAG: hypothetical protein M1356_01640 [Gammaproteobacteria bacterium]|nr:hypothetical protein [Gammaproteobacteria bacterium]
MTIRIPPSLNWLVGKRSRLAGQLKERLQDLEVLRADVAKIRSQLKAVDSVIKLHEIPLDPEDIPNTRVRSKNFFKYGDFTKAIFTVLSQKEPISTAELVEALQSHLGLEMTSSRARRDFRRKAYSRLKALRKEGRVGSQGDSSRVFWFIT